MCALRKPVGDIGRIETYTLLFIIIIIIIILLLLLLSLLLLLFRILYCAPLSKKKNGKRLHYLRCENSLLNHVNVSMFSRS